MLRGDFSRTARKKRFRVADSSQPTPRIRSDDDLLMIVRALTKLSVSRNGLRLRHDAPKTDMAHTGIRRQPASCAGAIARAVVRVTEE